MQSGGSRGNEGIGRAGKRRSCRTVTTRERHPGRPREAPAPIHSPARRARPASRGLASAPIRALRGGRILITTKYLAWDPPPRLRCSCSPRRGGAEPLEGPGGPGEPPRGRGTPRRAVPGCSAGARRSPGAGGLAVQKGLDGLVRRVTRRHGGVAVPWSCSPPVTGGRNETKRKKTKENERKHRRARGSAPHPSPAPPRPRAARPTRAGPARLGLAVAELRGPIRQRRRSAPSHGRPRCTGCGEPRGAADGPVAGGSAGAPGDAERVGYVCVARRRSARGRRGRRRLREECGTAEVNLPSAPRPGRREAHAGPGGRADRARRPVRRGRTCSLRPGRRGRTCSPLPGPGPGRSSVRAGVSGARRGGGPYLPTRA